MSDVGMQVSGKRSGSGSGGGNDPSLPFLHGEELVGLLLYLLSHRAEHLQLQ